MIFSISIITKPNDCSQCITLAADNIHTALKRAEEFFNLIGFEFEEGGSVCINSVVTPPQPLKERERNKHEE